MPFSLELPRRFAKQWSVKIRDKERLEPPHVTIIGGPNTWRWGLRERTFLDEEPDPDDVPEELLELIIEHWEELREAWDGMYPENEVASDEESGDGNG
jgi:hypothetical protein